MRAVLELNICLFLLGCIFDKPARPRTTAATEPSRADEQLDDDAGTELDDRGPT